MQMDSEHGVKKHSAEKADEWHSATSKIGRDFLVKQVPCQPLPPVLGMLFTACLCASLASAHLLQGLFSLCQGWLEKCVLLL